jgi:hypothetical protein
MFIFQALRFCVEQLVSIDETLEILADKEAVQIIRKSNEDILLGKMHAPSLIL